MDKQPAGYNPLDDIIQNIMADGGFVNTHTHLDRAYTISRDNFNLANSSLHEKWMLNDQLKQESTVGQIYDRICRALDFQIHHGVKVICSFIDVDKDVQDKAIKAAYKAREAWKNDITILYACHVLKGVLDPEAKRWFDLGAEMVDIIGGLPAKDALVDGVYDEAKADAHYDIIMDTAKRMGKMVHIHVDQNGRPDEYETLRMVQKTVEHDMQGKVVAIHCVSPAAQPKDYRNYLFTLMSQNKIMVVTCPSAWVDRIRNDFYVAPLHNSMTPLDEMTVPPYEIIAAMGTDNIQDIYKPITDGRMDTEVYLLMQALHFYKPELVAKIASTNGLKILGLLDYEA